MSEPTTEDGPTPGGVADQDEVTRWRSEEEEIQFRASHGADDVEAKGSELGEKGEERVITTARVDEKVPRGCGPASNEVCKLGEE